MCNVKVTVGYPYIVSPIVALTSAMPTHNIIIIQGGPARVRPTYIFDSNI